MVPDIAGWRRERMPQLPNSADFTLAPDWICEVLSPSTRKFDLGGKRAVYAREGVSYLWFLDPIARSLETFKLRGTTQWVLIDTLLEDASVSLPPFEAINFNLGELWSPPTIHKDVPSKLSNESERELAETTKLSSAAQSLLFLELLNQGFEGHSDH